MEALTIISGINLLLILSLMYLYVKSYMKVKSSFTLGLLLFTGLFLLQNLFVFYFNATMMPIYVEGVRSYMMTFMILQVLAFASLNWISWR